MCGGGGDKALDHRNSARQEPATATHLLGTHEVSPVSSPEAPLRTGAAGPAARRRLHKAAPRACGRDGTRHHSPRRPSPGQAVVRWPTAGRLQMAGARCRGPLTCWVAWPEVTPACGLPGCVPTEHPAEPVCRHQPARVPAEAGRRGLGVCSSSWRRPRRGGRARWAVAHGGDGAGGPCRGRLLVPVAWRSGRGSRARSHAVRPGRGFHC